MCEYIYVNPIVQTDTLRSLNLFCPAIKEKVQVKINRFGAVTNCVNQTLGCPVKKDDRFLCLLYSNPGAKSK